MLLKRTEKIEGPDTTEEQRTLITRMGWTGNIPDKAKYANRLIRRLRSIKGNKDKYRHALHMGAKAP